MEGVEAELALETGWCKLPFLAHKSRLYESTYLRLDLCLPVQEELADGRVASACRTQQRSMFVLTQESESKPLKAAVVNCFL